MTKLETGLHKKHVVLTGASGGIGTELTRLLLDEGANVTGSFYSSKRELAELLSQYPDQLSVVKTDIREEADVKGLFVRANDAFGRADVLVANAAIANLEEKPIHEMSLNQWTNTLSINLTGTFLSAKHFFSNLQEYPGEDASLILVGSTAGHFGEAWFADYATSKAALYGLLMSLKNEIVHLAPRGRVNLVNPGWTMTKMAEEALMDPEKVKRIHQTIPMRKTALPADIAHVILFLVSDYLSGHISGQAITVSGGMEGRVLYDLERSDDYKH
ncbi:MAG: SDR family oxidoreductase [Candidatus Thorarchaeota archaeon]|nr:MAG: SDR family oxidoreductase [Candidatus Thorarchaeota archaeon]